MNLKPGMRFDEIKIDKVFIGSCTNSRIEDLRIAAQTIQGKNVSKNIKLAMVVPGSGLVKKQAEKEITISAEVDGEESLPLNDPFVGDASLGGATTIATAVGAGEKRSEMSLYNFKLVAIMTGEYESFVSLINATGEIVTLQMNEELSPGVKLIGLNPGRAVFEKGPDSYLVINFKNQIQETSEPF